MAHLLAMKHKEDLSACVESILTNTGGYVIDASELQALFDSILSHTRGANAKYACEWNAQRLSNRTRHCRLPDELLVHAFSYMGLSDWLRVALVSQHWRKLVKTPIIWSKVIVAYPAKVAAATEEDKVAWLRTYLFKSAEAPLNIEWQAQTIGVAEIALLAANMHRTVHFNAPYPMYTGIGSSTLLHDAHRLETFSFSSEVGYTIADTGRVFRVPEDIFNFETAFGEGLPSKLRKVHVSVFTLPPQARSLRSVTDFASMMLANDDSNLRIFNFFPNLTVVKLSFQRYPIFPANIPATLHTLWIGPCVVPLVTDGHWESLLEAATHPIRTIHFEHIGALHVPFILFRRAVPREWKLTACKDAREATNSSSTAYTQFTMMPASSYTGSPCHSFYTANLLWELFICRPTGASFVAQNALLVSLQLTPPTFHALLKASTDLPALRVFILCTQEATDLPARRDMPCGDGRASAVKTATLAEFVLQFDGYDCKTAARWFTKFMPSHIRDMIEYKRERLERVAFVGRFFDVEYGQDHEWSRVAQLADAVHIGVSLDGESLLVPGEKEKASGESDWEQTDIAHVSRESDEEFEPYHSDRIIARLPWLPAAHTLSALSP